MRLRKSGGGELSLRNDELAHFLAAAPPGDGRRRGADVSCGPQRLPPPRETAVKKKVHKRTSSKSSRRRAKLKQKHKRARRRCTGGERSTYR